MESAVSNIRKMYTAPNSTQAVISKIFCIFFGILSQKRNSIIPIGNIQKSGWYRKAPVKSIRSTQNHALDIPQPAQEIPVRKRIGQVIPNTDCTYIHDQKNNKHHHLSSLRSCKVPIIQTGKIFPFFDTISYFILYYLQ